ncbi:hypothetical protein CC1G_11911 [Coprinopsis cinerea okayama7|uniref:Uncharacterized protein n=1 Tax=Coprinopsis cinerea (strain Okayama-7 / 130 / ATCC MYA-4618 / FGSC 9003) TaxID=240176 RepID=A8NDD3_COPC7|nr:hypothetical protein CC1G_11911 [Coprinopsis cinerea okayama7\|eukprot:XP_001832747.2 hypothetical protein CC1G_11911 [Coprinopsis cinerea okayama7\
MRLFKHSLTLFAAFASALTGVLSLPQDKSDVDIVAFLRAQKVPEVVPGPGLPSLESLNITSADLYEKTIGRMVTLHSTSPNEESSLTKRYNPTCDWIEISALDAWNCYYYLEYLDTTPCVVPPYGTRFCHTTAGYNDVAWYGSTNANLILCEAAKLPGEEFGS